MGKEKESEAKDEDIIIDRLKSIIDSCIKEFLAYVG